MSYANFYEVFIAPLKIPEGLPEDVDVLYPFSGNVIDLVCAFYNKFYQDENPRVMLIGINPGRFGAGVTGIPFTDPIRLANDCGIGNQLVKKQELSSVFIYDMIHQFGGVRKFYSHFFFSSVSPLGFVKDGKNMNYYDSKALQQRLEYYMVDSLKKQMALGARDDVAFSLGMGKNHEFLLFLNEKYQLFGRVEALPHPRWIMQYRLKSRDQYIDEYLARLSQAMK